MIFFFVFPSDQLVFPGYSTLPQSLPSPSIDRWFSSVSKQLISDSQLNCSEIKKKIFLHFCQQQLCNNRHNFFSVFIFLHSPASLTSAKHLGFDFFFCSHLLEHHLFVHLSVHLFLIKNFEDLNKEKASKRLVTEGYR